MRRLALALVLAALAGVLAGLLWPQPPASAQGRRIVFLSSVFDASADAWVTCGWHTGGCSYQDDGHALDLDVSGSGPSTWYYYYVRYNSPNNADVYLWNWDNQDTSLCAQTRAWTVEQGTSRGFEDYFHTTLTSSNFVISGAPYEYYYSRTLGKLKEDSDCLGGTGWTDYHVHQWSTPSYYTRNTTNIPYYGYEDCGAICVTIINVADYNNWFITKYSW